MRVIHSLCRRRSGSQRGKVLKKILGISLYIIGLIFSFLLCYGYRDFSLQLTAMFLFSVIGLTLGAYLVSSYMGVKENTNEVHEVHDDCEVIGKFSTQA